MGVTRKRNYAMDHDKNEENGSSKKRRKKKSGTCLRQQNQSESNGLLKWSTKEMEEGKNGP